MRSMDSSLPSGAAAANVEAVPSMGAPNGAEGAGAAAAEKLHISTFASESTLLGFHTFVRSHELRIPHQEVFHHSQVA